MTTSQLRIVHHGEGQGTTVRTVYKPFVLAIINDEHTVLTRKEFLAIGGNGLQVRNAIEIGKTLAKHLKRVYDTKTPWTEQEIKNVKKAIGYCSSLTKDEAAILASHLNYALEHNAKAYRITKEQDLKGKNYLLQNSLCLDGEMRKTSVLGWREIDIMKNLKCHEFLGFQNVGRGHYPEYVPLYKAVAKDGKTFIYTGVRYTFIELY